MLSLLPKIYGLTRRTLVMAYAGATGLLILACVLLSAAANMVGWRLPLYTGVIASTISDYESSSVPGQKPQC